MTGGEIAGIIGALAALLGAGGWIAKLGLRGTELRRAGAEADKAEAEAQGAQASATASTFGEWGKIFDALRAEVKRLGEDRDEIARRLRAAEKQDEDHVAAEEECQVALKRAVARIGRLEAAFPFAVLGEQLESDLASFFDLFDSASDCIAVTSPADRGTLLFVNRRFCEVLQRSKEEILSLGWRGLIVEEDLKATEEVESSAWEVPVVAFQNHFRRQDRAIIKLEWHAKTYGSRGIALAFARVIGAVRWPDRPGVPQ